MMASNLPITLAETENRELINDECKFPLSPFLLLYLLLFFLKLCAFAKNYIRNENCFTSLFLPRFRFVSTFESASKLPDSF